MTLEELKASLGEAVAPDHVFDEIRALWSDAQGDWEGAHVIAQELHSSQAAWVHAYLHRKEGDPHNAAYWYRRCGRPVCQASLDEEWDEIATALLAAEEA